MNETLTDAAARRCADALPEFDETGKCPVCRRRRDPRGFMESHSSDCAARDYREMRDRGRRP